MLLESIFAFSTERLKQFRLTEVICWKGRECSFFPCWPPAWLSTGDAGTTFVSTG